MNTKTAGNFPFYIQETDICCPYCHQSSLKADKCTKEKVFIRTFLSPQEPNPIFFNNPTTLKSLTALKKTIKIMGAIKKAVVIVSFVAQNL